MATAPLTVACGSCHTKFHVASALVRGKVIKFRCKRCRGPIEVDGTMAPAEGVEVALAPPTLPPAPADSTEPITFFGVSSRPSQVDFGASMRLSISDGWEGALPPAAEPAPPRAPTVVLTDRVLRPPPATLVVPGARGSRPGAAEDSYRELGAPTALPKLRSSESSVPNASPSSAVVPSARRSTPPFPAPPALAAPVPKSMRETAPLPGSGVPSWMASPRPASEHTAHNSPTAPPTVIHQSTPPRVPQHTGRLTAAQWAGQHQRVVTALVVAAAALAVTVMTWRNPRGGANATHPPLAAEPRTTAAQPAQDEPRPAEPAVTAAPPPVEPSAALAVSEPANPSPRAASSRPGRGSRTRGNARGSRAAGAEGADGELSGNAASAAQAMADVMKERELDPTVARAALDDAAHEAAGCRTDDTSARFARFAVTFAPSGRVSAVEIEGGPLAGTSVGACMIDAFKSAQVPAFSGSPVIVHKNVSF